MSTLLGQAILARQIFVGMRQLWPPELGDSRHHLSGHPEAADGVVSCDVLGYDAEERRQRTGPTARTRTEELQDSMDLAAQVASRDGAPWPGPVGGLGRSGRDLHGGSRRG